jgi:hypothetical protein
MVKLTGCAIACALLLQTAGACAQQPPPIAPEAVIDEAFIGRLRTWLANPIVALSVKAKNALHKDFTQAQIEELDGIWRKETKASDQPLISATLTSPLSIYLLRVQAGSQGAYAEVFVTDNRGLNVGQSSVTTDYWQGDEDKFQKTFDVGAEAVFIDKPEFDEETKAWRAQVSLTLTDPDTKKKIGAVTIEVNLTEMQRRATS